MSRPLTIGLFGYYKYGNFGDDLMAWLVASHLNSQNRRVIICGTPSIFTNALGIETEPDAATFTKQCDIIVIGGGGALLTRRHPKGPEGSALSQYTQDLAVIIRQKLDRCIPLACISLGGNGLPLYKIEPEERQEIVKHSDLLTLRTPHDYQALKPARHDIEYLPDLVWSTPQIIGGKKTQNDYPHIGIILYPQRSMGQLQFFAGQLQFALSQRPECHYSFIDVHARSYGQFGALSIRLNNNTSHFVIPDPATGLRMIQSLDLVITNRLHIGVAAMSYGIPCIGTGRSSKVQMFYESAGLTDWYWQTSFTNRLLYWLSSSENLHSLLNTFQAFDNEKLSRHAVQHLKRLDGFIDECSFT